jgi:hypothetical protein
VSSEKRDGRGSSEDPVRRPGQRCAVDDCPENGTQLRATNEGHFVLYCRIHEIQASMWFDAPKVLLEK